MDFSQLLDIINIFCALSVFLYLMVFILTGFLMFIFTKEAIKSEIGVLFTILMDVLWLVLISMGFGYYLPFFKAFH